MRKKRNGEMFSEEDEMDYAKLKREVKEIRLPWGELRHHMTWLKNAAVRNKIAYTINDLGGDRVLSQFEFDQYKWDVRWNSENMSSWFNHIHKWRTCVSWKQMLDYFQFLDTLLVNTENAIRDCDFSEDENPALDKLNILLKIYNPPKTKWLFDEVCIRHGEKVALYAIREYFISWQEQFAKNFSTIFDDNKKDDDDSDDEND